MIMLDALSRHRKPILKFLLFSFTVPIIGACLLLADFLFVVNWAKYRAYSFAPPEYPGSELVGKWQSGGPETMWDRRTYRTSDSVNQVLTFMEEYMPGFVEENEPEMGTVYHNYVQDDSSRLAKRAAEIACQSLFCLEKSAFTYPSTGVSFYSDPGNPTNTIIKVWIDWPAP